MPNLMFSARTYRIFTVESDNDILTLEELREIVESHTIRDLPGSSKTNIQRLIIEESYE